MVRNICRALSETIPAGKYWNKAFGSRQLICVGNLPPTVSQASKSPTLSVSAIQVGSRHGRRGRGRSGRRVCACGRRPRAQTEPTQYPVPGFAERGPACAQTNTNHISPFRNRMKGMVAHTVVLIQSIIFYTYI
jgi:hypothetical protein